MPWCRRDSFFSSSELQIFLSRCGSLRHVSYDNSAFLCGRTDKPDPHLQRRTGEHDTRHRPCGCPSQSVIHTSHTHASRDDARYDAYARTRTRVQTADIRTYIPSRDDTYIHHTAITDAHAPIASHAPQHSRQRGHRLCRSRPARHTLARRRGKQGTGVWMQVPPPLVARARYVPRTAGGRVVDLVGAG